MSSEGKPQKNASVRSLEPVFHSHSFSPQLRLYATVHQLPFVRFPRQRTFSQVKRVFHSRVCASHTAAVWCLVLLVWPSEEASRNCPCPERKYKKKTRKGNPTERDIFFRPLPAGQQLLRSLWKVHRETSSSSTSKLHFETLKKNFFPPHSFRQRRFCYRGFFPVSFRGAFPQSFPSGRARQTLN